MNVLIVVQRCDKCGYEQEVFEFPSVYALPDGDLPVLARHAWCLDQACMVRAEGTLDVEAIEETLALILAYPSDEDDPETWRRRLVWRRTRQAPDRCLECGSSRLGIASTDADDPWVEHPNCGGKIHIVNMDVRDFPDATPRRYTPEGERLQGG